MKRRKRIVIALGGNALGKDIEEQKEAVAKTAKVIVDLAQQGLDIIVTHGNGPQVGMIQNAMDNLIVMQQNYKQVPLPTSVAMSQGYIGIDLQNAIKYELLSRNIDGKVSTILSQVEVDPKDPAFDNPTKPIGRFLTKEEAEENEANGIRCMEDAGRGYRIVVASPMPKRIRELETIKTLVGAGHIVITCGGGGIPIISDEDGRLVGVNAVIDKDNASSLLAAQLGADHLRGYGAFPDQVVESFFGGRALDFVAVDVGGADRFVSLLCTFGLGLVVEPAGVFFAEELGNTT